jgi:energy-coupling factor transporter ATP-binding protein EcfA2
MWFVEKIEINGGFLPGLKVNLPQGLTCIIGPRGSGKSTLAESLRFAVCGTSAAPKHCLDLVQANLAGGALVTIQLRLKVRVATQLREASGSNPFFCLRTEGRSALLISIEVRFCLSTHTVVLKLKL